MVGLTGIDVATGKKGEEGDWNKWSIPAQYRNRKCDSLQFSRNGLEMHEVAEPSSSALPEGSCRYRQWKETSGIS